MKLNIITYISLLILVSCKPTEKTLIKHDSGQLNSCRVMFYNTENLQHSSNDSLKNDDEFTPDGVRHWTDYRYQQKLNNIYKVVMAVGEGTVPALIGLCEIENRTCLDDLLNRTPLFKYQYKISHFESPDARGVDVGLLYQPDVFRIISERAIPIVFPLEMTNSTTRDILYVKGILSGKDTLHVFVNHWPSKYGGAKESEPLRIFVAQRLKSICDSISSQNANAKILIMGDLNDEPEDYSITQGLKALNNWSATEPQKLYNLSYHLQYVEQQWSNKFQDHAGIIDQMIVSGALLADTAKIHTSQSLARIFSSEFLLMDDDKYLGKKPFRTYVGMQYIGGFSDHLPAVVDIVFGE